MLGVGIVTGVVWGIFSMQEECGAINYRKREIYLFMVKSENQHTSVNNLMTPEANQTILSNQNSHGVAQIYMFYTAIKRR